jgi:hypothetical protein
LRDIDKRRGRELSLEGRESGGLMFAVRRLHCQLVTVKKKAAWATEK